MIIKQEADPKQKSLRTEATHTFGTCCRDRQYFKIIFTRHVASDLGCNKDIILEWQ